MATFKAETLNEVDWTNSLSAGIKDFWFLDGTLNAGLGEAPDFYFYQTHATEHVGTKNGEVYLYGDHSGSDDDELVTTDVMETANSLSEISVCLVLTPENYTTGQNEIFYHGDSLGFFLELRSSMVQIGIAGDNGFQYYYHLPISALKWGEANVFVISMSKNPNILNVSVNGVTQAEAIGSTGSLSYLGGGLSATDTFFVNQSSHPNFYKARGTFHAMTLWHRFLTDAEIAQLVADPYQIFRTAEDAVNDYNLVLDTNSHVDIPALATTNNSSNINWDLETSIAPTSTENFIVLGVATGTAYVLYINLTTGDIYYSSNSGGAVLIGTGFPLDDGLHTLKVSLRWSGGDKVFTCSIDGVAQAPYTHANAGIWGFTQIGASLSDGRVGAVAYLKFTDLENSANNRYYDFNRTQGTVVPELLNGQNGTLVGFPTESGYVYENGEIVGYKFNGVDTAASAPLQQEVSGDFELECVVRIDATGADGALMAVSSSDRVSLIGVGLVNNKLKLYSINPAQTAGDTNITVVAGTEYSLRVVYEHSLNKISLYVDNATTAQHATTGINIASEYTATHVIFAGEAYDNRHISATFKSASFTESLVALNASSWDFTTGDVDSIPDTVNGNNADIINAKTSGWMPIIEKQVFTVRADNLGDFPNIQSAVNTVGTNIGHQKVIAYDDENYGTGGQSFTPNGCDILEICAETSRHFSNDLLNPIKLSSSSTAYTVRLDGKDNSGSKVFFHGFFVENTSSGNALEKYWATDPSGLVSVRDCKVTSVGGVGFSTAYNAGTNLPVEIKRVLAADCKNSGFHGKNNPNVTFIDCMAVNNAKVETADVQYSAGFADVKYAINCIASGSTQTGDFSGSSRVLTNCVSSDATATGDGCLAGIDFTGAFVNG